MRREGEVLPNAIALGVGFQAGDAKSGELVASSFRNVVNYHVSKPVWNETVKVAVPADKFLTSHLRFLIRHRSRYDTKEKSAPYALALLKLVNEYEKTAVKDGEHKLFVYKIDKKGSNDVITKAEYLDLQQIKSNYVKQHRSGWGLTHAKDVLVVSTRLASTKLVQNEGLLSLLKWKSEVEKLSMNLQIFDQKVNGDELVIFISDVLDALFDILIESSSQYDERVFKSLLKCISLITEDENYQQFIPVLELYIASNFCATLAYKKLLFLVKDCADGGTLHPRDLKTAMKCLKYIFKFISRSRVLFVELYGDSDQESFEELLKDVLNALVRIMYSTSNDLHQAQADCLSNVLESVPDLVLICDNAALAEIIVRMIMSLPEGQLISDKAETIKTLVHSDLFLDPACRRIIVPEIAKELTKNLDTADVEAPLRKARSSVSKKDDNVVDTCTQTLGDLLEKLHQIKGENAEDIGTVMDLCLETVVNAVSSKRSSNRHAEVSNMISLFNAMTPHHYTSFVGKFVNPEGEFDADAREQLTFFVLKVLDVFKMLILKPVFPKDWATMIMLQNAVILKALCELSHTIRDHMTAPHFDIQAWNDFFSCAIAFVTQPSLQLEKFSENKRSAILKEYKDMRKDMSQEVRKMWFNLGQNKILFIPAMVGPILDMSLIPEPELRKATIPIFFDMMQCEYFSKISGGDQEGATAT